MKNIRTKAKILFLAIFALLLGMCIYADAVKSSPRSLVNICILGFMMHAYMEKKSSREIIKNKNLEYLFKENPHDKQKYLRAMINNIPMAAFLMDVKGKYICGNIEFLNLLNLNENAVSGCNIFCKFLGCTPVTFDKTLDFITKEKQTLTFEHFYKFQQKNSGWYRIYLSPFCNKKGEAEGVTVFLQDIEAEIEVNRQKEQFVATLSHDLKTPVIAQTRSIELLLKEIFGKLSPEQKELLELTLESCNHLYNLISTIQYSYKFDNDEIILAPADVNILDIITECCDEVSKLAKERHVEIVINPFLKHNEIKADKKFLKDAILYLIENSISYAYENTKIYVELSDENNELSLKIHTRSPYIPENLLHTMFDKYLGQTETYSKIGFCLKLYYSSQIIQAHNGKILAYSDPLNKNTFGFTIPQLREEISAIA